MQEYQVLYLLTCVILDKTNFTAVHAHEHDDFDCEVIEVAAFLSAGIYLAKV